MPGWRNWQTRCLEGAVPFGCMSSNLIPGTIPLRLFEQVSFLLDDSFDRLRSAQGRRGQVVRQRFAKPLSPVRFRSAPPKQFPRIPSRTCRDGGIGRRSRLKICRGISLCGFESHSRHHRRYRSTVLLSNTDFCPPRMTLRHKPTCKRHNFTLTLTITDCAPDRS